MGEEAVKTDRGCVEARQPQEADTITAPPVKSITISDKTAVNSINISSCWDFEFTATELPFLALRDSLNMSDVWRDLPGCDVPRPSQIQ